MFDLENEQVPRINEDVDLVRIKEDNYCQIGDLVIADASEDYNDIGKTIEIVNLGNKKTLAGLHTFLARPTENKVALGFSGYLMQSWTVRKQVMTIAQGTKVLGLATGRLGKVNLYLPTLPEQIKIANFLTAVDAKIANLSEEKSLLENYKKGVMQKIFSQELRFKQDDGSDFPEWEIRKLSYYLEVSNLKNRELKYDKTDVLSVSGEFGIVNQIEFQGRSFAGESVENYGVVETGDIVYTKSPLKSNPYGIIKVNKGKSGIVSTLYAVYKCRKDLNGRFLDYYFQLDDNTNRYLRPLVQKGSKNDMKINNSKVLIDPVLFPSLIEQDKIVDFLEVIDRKIDKLRFEIDHSQEWKKGLLQQLFV